MFKSNLSKLFSAYDFEKLSKTIRTRFATVAADAGHRSARSHAPVGEQPEDEHPGQLRDALYKAVEEHSNRTTAVIAIPREISYRFAVIFGDKRHEANGFMEIAKKDAVAATKKEFKTITHDALVEMNNEERGKL